MHMRHLQKLVSLLAVAGLAAATLPAHATLIEVPLPTLNDSLQNLTNGSNYPTSGALTVGGIPFTIAQDANGNNMWATFLLPVPVLDIPVNVFGAVTGYTLMNSFFGVCGTTIGSVEFKGTGGADVIFNLVEGTNIRDHFTGVFCNTIDPGTPTINFGGDVHLDLQTFVLPASFASETLTHIILTGFKQGGGGEPFITSVTVQDGVNPAPEPGTLMLLGVGLAAFVSVQRKGRRETAA